jgi:HEAT repeat protein
LGELGEAIDVSTLVTILLQDDQNEVRQAAAYALGLIGDATSVEPLVNALLDLSQSSRVRGAVAEALADLKDRRAVAPLIEVLMDESAEVRFWAAFALGELGDAEALSELARLSATDDGSLPGIGTVRDEAASAMKQIYNRRGIV